MTLSDVLEHFAYNKWANDRTLDAIRPLTPEQLTRNLGSSFPSICETAAHIASAEWIWLRRWKGQSPAAHARKIMRANFGLELMVFQPSSRDLSA